MLVTECKGFAKRDSRKNITGKIRIDNKQISRKNEPAMNILRLLRVF